MNGPYNPPRAPRALAGRGPSIPRAPPPPRTAARPARRARERARGGGAPRGPPVRPPRGPRSAQPRPGAPRAGRGISPGVVRGLAVRAGPAPHRALQQGPQPRAARRAAALPRHLGSQRAHLPRRDPARAGRGGGGDPRWGARRGSPVDRGLRRARSEGRLVVGAHQCRPCSRRGLVRERALGDRPPRGQSALLRPARAPRPPPSCWPNASPRTRPSCTGSSAATAPPA